MSKPSRIPGTYVSDAEAKQLAQLLQTFREYIVSHEARLDAIEGFINAQIEAQVALAQEITEGSEEAETEESTWEDEGGLVEREPADNPEEG